MPCFLLDPTSFRIGRNEVPARVQQKALFRVSQMQNAHVAAASLCASCKCFKGPVLLLLGCQNSHVRFQNAPAAMQASLVLAAQRYGLRLLGLATHSFNSNI